MSLADVGEFSVIEQLSSLLDPVDSRVLCGIGDDAAVLARPLESTNSLVLATDLLLEGTHFSFDFSSPEDVGWKSVAVNISDIAAMGGLADAMVVGLQTPKSCPLDFISRIYSGLSEAAKFYGVNVVGGDTVCSERIALSISVLGHCQHEAIRRSGAKPGDELWVSGTIGAAAAGLEYLKQTSQLDEERKGKIVAPAPEIEHALSSHRRPLARVELGGVLAERALATSMIDISDGLLADALHLSNASQLGISISLSDVPLDSAVEVFSLPEEIAFSAGDDYELLFTAPREAFAELEQVSSENCRLTKIGSVSAADKEPGLRLLKESGESLSMQEYASEFDLESLGYKHF